MASVRGHGDKAHPDHDARRRRRGALGWGGGALRRRTSARALRNRRLVRSPIWLFQHGLGWVLGPRVCLVEHVGRTSRKRRFVCLEVVERPAADVFVLVSGFGKRAQWYRNLVASPQCWITVGRTRRPARATMLSDAESAEVLSRYATSHPRAWATLRGVIEEAVGHRVDVLPAVRIDRS